MLSIIIYLFFAILFIKFSHQYLIHHLKKWVHHHHHFLNYFIFLINYYSLNFKFNPIDLILKYNH